MVKNTLLLLVTLVSISVQSNVTEPSHKEITLDDIFLKGTFSGRTVAGLRSMNDGVHYTIMEGGTTIKKFSFKTGQEVDVIFEAADYSEKDPGWVIFSNYEFCSDEKKILFTTNREQIYRHSFRADYYIWDIEKLTMTQLSEDGRQQLATFSPDGSKVAFVFENNLYYRDLASDRIVQVTGDGKINEIINGAPDWVYEEEFGFSKAFAWSPDSRMLAYYRFYESRVKMFNMTFYGELYPQWSQFKYPKAGEDNSVVTIHTYDLVSRRSVRMDTGPETDQYIPLIKWTADPERVAIYRLNRLQNHIEVLIADAVNGSAGILWEERNSKFIRETSADMITFMEDGKHFVVMSERSGWSYGGFMTPSIPNATCGPPKRILMVMMITLPLIMWKNLKGIL